MVVNTNINSFKINETLSNNTNRLNNSKDTINFEREVSKVDEHNFELSIADRLRIKVSSLNQSVDNGLSAVAMLQIADKAMVNQSNILNSIRSELIQAKIMPKDKEEREGIIRDVNRLLFELDNIAASTRYKGTNLLQKSGADTSVIEELRFRLGEVDSSYISIDTDDIQSNTEGLGLEVLKEYKDGVEFTFDKAREYADVVESALDKLDSYRKQYGITQSQIELDTKAMMNNASNQIEQNSITQEMNYADESADLVHNHVMELTGGYVLSQANVTPKNVVNLLRT